MALRRAKTVAARKTEAGTIAAAGMPPQAAAGVPATATPARALTAVMAPPGTGVPPPGLDLELRDQAQQSIRFYHSVGTEQRWTWCKTYYVNLGFSFSFCGYFM